MKRKLIALLITTLLIISTYSLFLTIYKNKFDNPPIVSDGILDLKDTDITKKGILSLNGEWEFYPNKLLTSQDFSKMTNLQNERIIIPGNWKSNFKHVNFATYRLHVNVEDIDQVYGLKTSSIQVANRIFINGKVVGESGNPDEKNAAYRAKNKPYTAYFTFKPGLNEIIVQVANYDFGPSSGINEPIQLGYYQNISKQHENTLIHDWMDVTVFLLSGGLFLVLFYRRNEQYSFLLFSLLCFFLALFSAVRGERILLDILPSLPFQIYWHTQGIAALGTGFSLLYYLYFEFKPYCSKLLLKAMSILGTLLVIILIFIPPIYIPNLFRYGLSLFTNLSIMYALYVLVLATINRVQGSYYLVIAALSLNIYASVQNLTSIYFTPIYLLDKSSILFVLMLAFLMANRFSLAFNEIEHLTSKLMRLDQLKNAFLTNTSHEFKTPLHGILNIADAMLKHNQQPLHPEQQEKIQLISTITRRLSRLVYDILDFSKLKHGDLHISPVAVDVKSSIDIYLNMFSYLIKDKQIELINHIPDKLPPILVDEDRFSQIINNLIDNAIKYTPSGTIEMTAEQSNDRVNIFIKDTGIGIEDDRLPYIFEPFQSTQLESSESFGLGLPIVAQLVQLQNGSIFVESEKGVGTTFILSFPIAKGMEVKQNSQNLTQRADSTELFHFDTPYYTYGPSDYTVLIVDDNFYNLKVLVDILSAMDCSVIAVKNGKEALTEVYKNKIDLVILDLMMPGLSGFEVCQTIRKDYSSLELPILIVTAGGQMQDKIIALETGANDFLFKPFEMEELQARINSLLLMKKSLEKVVQMEIAFLQSQINPHFLFNVLNTITALSYTNVEKSRELTVNFANYLRGSFQFSNLEKRISFSQELELIKNYIAIEQARFRERLKVTYDIDIAMYSVQVLPLLIQPLVENAIRHGIGEKVEGGTVEIIAYQNDNLCTFIIKDNGIGMTEEFVQKHIFNEHDLSKGVGIKNIRKRLKYEYGTELEIESVFGQGTTVTIRYPK